MKAMVLNRIGRMEERRPPLILTDIPEPVPASGEILVKVTVCGVCHTELDEIEGRTPPPRLPIVPGHQVVGQVVGLGPGADRFKTGDRVGIAWIFSACGDCPFCRSGNENLCSDFKATGRDVHGGYAQYMRVPEDFAHPIPALFTDAEAAPLLCAGAVGYRSLRLANMKDNQAIGLTGFGASGHLVLKMVRHRYPKARAYVFARSANQQAFAKKLGAVWAGVSEDQPPEPLNAIIDTTPVWKPVVAALSHLAPGGRLVINAIRKEDHDKEELLRLDYGAHLWMEREIKSVANVSRQDVKEFLSLAGEMDIRPTVQEFPLEEANQALMELRTRKVHGAKVLRIA
jgi:propanol-preferring alcohol dehydrogenase